jgi:Peptidase family M28
MPLQFLLAAFIACQSAPAAVVTAGARTFDLQARRTIQARLHRFSNDNSEREAILKQMFQEDGCRPPRLEEQRVEQEKLPNLTCTLAGASNSMIIVGAHFDHVKIGQGVVDNWSGASLLPTLYASLQHVTRKHTFVFIGFTDEEGGLVGSRFYAGHLTAEQQARIRAMINLDSLGLASTKIFLTHSDRELFEKLERLAHLMKLPVEVVNVPGADEDSEAFRRRKIPTLMVHSVTPPTWPILHTARDTLAAVDMTAYYGTYRLIAAYLADLDQKLR